MLNQRVDERDRVALLVDDREIDGIGVKREVGFVPITHRLVETDVLTELRRVVEREQLVDRHVNLIGIADQAVAHAVGEPGRLRLEMKPLDAQRIEARELEAGQDVEHDQHGDALTVGWNLQHLIAAIGRLDRG